MGLESGIQFQIFWPLAGHRQPCRLPKKHHRPRKRQKEQGHQEITESNHSAKLCPWAGEGSADADASAWNPDILFWPM